MKDNEKKVKLTEEEAKKEVQTEEECVQLTEEELAQVSGGLDSKREDRAGVISFTLDVPVTEEADVVDVN